MMTGQEILDRLCQGLINFPPLSFSVFDLSPAFPAGRGRHFRPDVLVEAAWGRRRFRFVVECKAYCSLKILRDAVASVSAAAGATNAHPMILTSWLPLEQLKELEENEVSGIDLNGNGIVIVPGKLLVFRTGIPNAYPRSLPIRNIYRGISSIVGRALLLEPRFKSVGSIREEITSRGGRVALSTVSRVLRQMEEDLIISREGREVRLLQPDKLLERLSTDYRQPRILSRSTGKSPLSLDEISKRMSRFAHSSGLRIVLTGAASVNRYAAMAREPILSFYCMEHTQKLLQRINVQAQPTDRFVNIELLQTEDETVYFDLRMEPEGVFASLLQAWLELANGDKRQQDVSRQIKKIILKNPGAP
ncbi:MAG: hypothetical protein ABIJ56_06490 [Pseudomonadota bacterium]